MRDQPRRRRAVGPLALSLLRPAFRFSSARDAYVLRVAGGRFGPVFVPRGATPSPEVDAPVVLSEPVLPPTGRFARSEGADAAETSADASATRSRRR